MVMERVAEVVGRRGDGALLHKVEELRRNSGAGHDVSEDQSLKLQLLPLGQAEVAPHS